MKRIAIALLFVFPTVAAAQRDARVPDPDPEVERKSFIVAPGFEVNLFAADPLLAKPIQMNFDPPGRLWVASQRGLSADQARPEGQRQDHHPRRHRRRRQGRQDHRLRRRPAHPHRRRARRRRRLRRQQHRARCTSRDTDGDGKADTPPRRALRLRHRGHAPHPPHASAGARTAMLYFNQSIYIHSHIETPHGVRRLNGGGIWQFRPGDDASWKCSSRGWCNSWGHSLRPLGPVVRHRRRRRRGHQLRRPRRLLSRSRGRMRSASCTA